MGTPYVGEIRMFAGNFAPAGWALCQGQILPIVGNETLFNLIGTTYGGDGVNTFALPNLQSRVPVHVGTGGGQSVALAQTGGAETVTLTVQQIPAHTHVPQCSNNTQGGDSNLPGNSVWAASTIGGVYADTAPGQNMSPDAIGSSGGSQPHDNMVPFLVINFIISLFGIFPSPV